VPLRGAGASGVRDWIWKGVNNGHARLEAVIDYPAGTHPLRHRIEFTETAARFELLDEAIENSVPDPDHDDPFFFYRYQQGRPALSVRDGGRRQLRREDVAPDESILSQRRDPDQYPELAHLADVYSKVRVYREWSFGRTSVFRGPPLHDMESRDRRVIQDAISQATRNCKNAYQKGKRSFQVLGELNPTELRKYLPSFLRCEQLLRERL
jgi:predicted ATPase